MKQEKKTKIVYINMTKALPWLIRWCSYRIRNSIDKTSKKNTNLTENHWIHSRLWSKSRSTMTKKSSISTNKQWFSRCKIFWHQIMSGVMNELKKSENMSSNCKNWLKLITTQSPMFYCWIRSKSDHGSNWKHQSLFPTIESSTRNLLIWNLKNLKIYSVMIMRNYRIIMW